MKQKSALLATLLCPMMLVSCTQARVAVRVSPLSSVEAERSSTSLAKGRMLFARREYALALESFQRAVREDPAGADGYNGLAASYDQLGRFDLSRRYYELALARAPEDLRILRNLARSLDRQGDRLAVRKLMAEVALLTSAQTPPGAVYVAPMPAPALMPMPMPVPAPAAPAMVEAAQPVGILWKLAALVGLSPPSKIHAAVGEVDIVLPEPQPAVTRQDVSLRIVNAVGRRRLAAHMRTHLAGSGWTTSDISDSRPRLRRSIILVSQQDRLQAQRLAASLPFAPKVRERPSLGHMVLVLGADSTPFDDHLRQTAGS